MQAWLKQLRGPIGLALLMGMATASPAVASEADLVLPDLTQVSFFGMSGWSLLVGGLFVCLLGLLFGLVIYVQLKNLPVHESMREISELIYETCKTYLITQGRFRSFSRCFIE